MRGLLIVALATPGVLWFGIFYYNVRIIFHRRPGIGILEASWGQMIPFNPEAYSEQGQAFRRRYVTCVVGFLFSLFVAAIVGAAVELG